MTSSRTFQLILSLLLFYPAFSQENCPVIVVKTSSPSSTVSGSFVLTDKKGEFLSGNAFENGSFSISCPETDSFSMIVTVSGHEPFVRQFVFPFPANDTLMLTESPAELDEVTISARQPVFEKTSDGLRIRVAGTIIGKSATSSELLRRIPGAGIVSGKLQLFGRGEALIIINGKETTLESFKSIPPSEIVSVEWITNPGAAFDAKGKAVLLVQLKKGYRDGINGSLAENFSLSNVPGESFTHYWLNTATGVLNFRRNRFSVTSSYTNEVGVNWMENTFRVTSATSGGTYKTDGYYTEDNHNSSVHNYRLGLGFDLTKNSSFSVQYDGLYHFFDLDVLQRSCYYSPDLTSTLIQMNNAATTNLINHSFNANFTQKTDTNGGTWFTGIQYNRFYNGLADNITERMDYATGDSAFYDRQNRGKNTIEIYAAQTDYHTLFKRFTLDAGVKYSYVSNSGDIRFYSKKQSEEQYVSNPALANSTLYKEQVPAVYASIKTNLKNWRTQAGLRAEYTVANGYSYKLEQTIIDSQYLNLFPYLSLQRPLNDQWNMSFSYARKINRPLYQDLDPFLWYLDSLTSIQGNPKLQPELLHQTDLNFSGEFLTFRLSYILSQNTIWAFTLPGATGSNSWVYQKTNVKQRHMTSCAIDIPVEKGKYSGFTTLAFNLFAFRDDRPEFSTAAARPTLYAYTYHKYSVGKSTDLELTGEYYSSANDGFTNRSPYYSFTFGIAQRVGDHWNLLITANDFLRTARWKGERTLNTISNQYDQRRNSRELRITINYTFGQLRNVTYKNQQTSEKELNRIKK